MEAINEGNRTLQDWFETPLWQQNGFETKKTRWKGGDVGKEKRDEKDLCYKIEDNPQGDFPVVLVLV